MELTIKTAPSTENTQSLKKLSLPLGMRMIQWAYPRLERMAPPLAYSWFVRMFFAPPRYKVPAHEQAILQQAKLFGVTVRGHQVQCYCWGQGPAVLMVHGWAGRASQFKSLVEYFTKAGHQVISFDSIAHGKTSGRETTIIDFKDAILEIERAVGKLKAVIGHSLGGAASLYAISEGLKVNSLITIATPTLGDEIIQEFAARLHASDKAQQYLKQVIKRRLDRTFNEFMASHFITKLKHEISMLIIHDENDKEASIRNAECLVELYPKAIYHKTTGLGHVRILRDEAVIERCREFIEEL